MHPHELFIVDNSDSDWKVLRYLKEWCELSKAIDIASGFFEIGSLLALDGKWQTVQNLRILMGAEMSLRTKKAFVDALEEINARLERSLESEKTKNDFLEGVPAIVESIRSGQLNCRVYRHDKFHAKAYITHAEREILGSAALVGSSNFTYPGIAQNVELNVRITGPEVAVLQEWFERHWDAAEDVSPDILRTIEHHTRERPPFEIWAKALHEYARDTGPTPDQWDREHSRIFPLLAKYQQDAYRNLCEIAGRYGAAFLCDGVGLGKTYVGLMVLERMIAREGKRVVVFAPKAAREDVWIPAIEKLLPHLHSDFQPLVVYNHTDLHKTTQSWPERMATTLRDADVVLIDEAHHFRNPGVAGEGVKAMSRYRKLQGYLAQESSRRKELYFLTATPINNSVHDFRHILALLTGEDESWFSKGIRNLGIHSLRSYFRKLEKRYLENSDARQATQQNLQELFDLGEGPDLFGELVVQRSRAYVRASEKLEAGSSVAFPEREVPRVAKYQLRITYGRLLDSVAQAFDRKKPLFALALYNPLSYLIKRPAEDDFESGRQKQVVALIRTLFLKRFESSAPAFELSCWRLLKKLLAWAEVHADREHHQNRLERWRTKHKRLLSIAGYHEDDNQGKLFPDDEEEEDQFLSNADFDEVERLEPSLYRIEDMIDDTLDDLEQLAEFLTLVRDVRPDRDTKLNALAKLLRESSELQNRKVIVFTEFSDTAKYLEEELRNRGITELERIDGESNQQQRSAIVHRFAPFYNEQPSPRSEEEIRVLIATDILAEGLNLQDADRLINFDLHWNPVRLMQRIGRVDRRLNPATEARLLEANPFLKNSRGKIIYWNFLPPEELEELLSIYKRVNKKTLVISRTFGIEGRKLLRPDDSFEPVREINEQFEGQQTASEKLLLEYQSLVHKHPALVARLSDFPLKAFSGRESPAPDTRAVFLCFRIPRPDPEIADPSTGLHIWTENAGDTVWLLFNNEGEPIKGDSAAFARLIRSTPETPRRCNFNRETLAKIRARAEKELVKSHLRPLQAPAGVNPILKCWMEIN